MSMKSMVDRKLGKEDVRSGNEDAMNYLANDRPMFSKKEKRAWAIKKRAEELLIDTGRPEPEWMRDSSLLPKAPPGRASNP